jgi:lysophospholipase L1-like esterase
MIAAIAITVVLVVAAIMPITEPSTHGTRRMLPHDRSQPLTYVALGDSTVVGVGASDAQRNYVSRLADRLGSIYPHARMANLGVSGATSADVAAGQLSRAVELQPVLITLSVGPNDIMQGKDAQQYEHNLDTIFSTLAQATDAVVVVNLMPDLAAAPRFPAELKQTISKQTAGFNAALEHAAGKYDVEIVDLYTPSQQEMPTHPERVSGDQYHPSDAGYARWAELMWQAIEARIG